MWFSCEFQGLKVWNVWNILSFIEMFAFFVDICGKARKHDSWFGSNGLLKGKSEVRSFSISFSVNFLCIQWWQCAKQKCRIQLTNTCKKHPYRKHLKNTYTILRRPHFCCEAFGPLLSHESDLGPPQPSAATQPLAGCIPTAPCARGGLECHDGKDAAQHHNGEFLVRLRFANWNCQTSEVACLQAKGNTACVWNEDLGGSRTCRTSLQKWKNWKWSQVGS